MAYILDFSAKDLVVSNELSNKDKITAYYNIYLKAGLCGKKW